MFPTMPNVPAYMAYREHTTTTSTTTTTTVTTNTTTTITSAFNLYLRPPPTPWMSNPGLINVAAMPSTMSVNSISTPIMSYGPLQSMVNKWRHLQEHDTYLLFPMNQFNTWNQALVESGNKITVLRNDMEKVKLDQGRLERELDSVLVQQKELENMLSPMEEFLKEQNRCLKVLYAHKPYERICKIAEFIDAELKRMSQNLNDIIFYLTSVANTGGVDLPIQQICQIMNAHLESLQWIIYNSGIMQSKAQEISLAFEEFRRKEREYTMHFTFK